ncbi:MAG: hypothetical protein JWP81_2631 [Ferruginibacter sp.]|nr:hypothetical protein [Ferruginibacter sp.]
MKSKKILPLARNSLYTIMIMFLLLSVVSCARKISFLTSSVVPAARGTVKVKKDDNKNYAIRIQLVNLAEPKRLQPSKATYVVWMESSGQPIKNIGQINSSSGLFSSTLKGSFETVSTFKPTKIFITAEDDPEIRYPGSQVVLSTDYF